MSKRAVAYTMTEIFGSLCAIQSSIAQRRGDRGEEEEIIVDAA